MAGHDKSAGSQGSIQSASARVAEKPASQHRATPTGSLNSIENDGSNTGSPDRVHAHGRRGGSVDQTQAQTQTQTQMQAQAHPQAHPQQPSDLSVSNLQSAAARGS